MKDLYDYIRIIYQAIPSATLVGAIPRPMHQYWPMVVLLRIKPNENKSPFLHSELLHWKRPRSLLKGHLCRVKESYQGASSLPGRPQLVYKRPIITNVDI